VALLLALVYAAHQDFWFWRAARPLVFGFLPIGLFYHAAYTVAASALMWLLVKYRWPADLEEANERQPVSHASGAGMSGVPASERVGGTGGAKPPGKT
jgi:hypothetical protein